MFAFSVATFLAELTKHEPAIVTQMTEAVNKGRTDGVFFRFEKTAMQQCPNDSIDYALMEKTDKAAVVEADMGWSDIGSWLALWRASAKDEQGNVVAGDVILEDVKNSLIHSGDSLVAAVGLRDTMVVETADAVLVAPLSRSQEVKKIVNTNRESGTSFIFTRPSTAPGEAIPPLSCMTAFRSNGSRSTRRRNSPCRCTTTGTNTGSWSRERRR